MAAQRPVESNSSLSKMEGCSWSSLLAADVNESPVRTRRDSEKNGLLSSLIMSPKKRSADDRVDNGITKLKKKDISMFGVYPGRDQCYLVVCEHCNLNYKPQALAQHIELRHSHILPPSIETPPPSTRSEASSGSTSSLNNEKSQSSLLAALNPIVVIEKMDLDKIKMEMEPAVIVNTINLTSQLDTGPRASPGPLPGQAVSIAMTTPPGPDPGGGHYDLLQAAVASAYVDSPRAASVPPVVTEAMDMKPVIPPGAPLTMSTPLLITGAALPVSATAASGELITLTAAPDPALGTSVQLNATPVAAKKPPAKKSKSSASFSGILREKLLPCKDREYDPNKHCGVQPPEADKPCTRSLTCKTHSLTLRRQVLGRSKNFDDLLNEHRVLKETALREAGKEPKPTKKQLKLKEQEQKRAALAASATDDNSNSSNLQVNKGTTSGVVNTQASAKASQEASRALQQQLTQRLQVLPKTPPSSSTNSSSASSTVPGTPATPVKESFTLSSLLNTPIQGPPPLTLPLDVIYSSNSNQTASNGSQASSNLFNHSLNHGTLTPVHGPHQNSIQNGSMPSPRTPSRPPLPSPTPFVSSPAVLNSSPTISAALGHSLPPPLSVPQNPVITSPDGGLYVRHHPQPLSMNTFNSRNVRASPLARGVNGTFVTNSPSSRLSGTLRASNRQQDKTYSALRTLFNGNTDAQLRRSARCRTGLTNSGDQHSNHNQFSSNQNASNLIANSPSLNSLLEAGIQNHPRTLTTNLTGLSKKSVGKASENANLVPVFNQGHNMSNFSPDKLFVSPSSVNSVPSVNSVSQSPLPSPNISITASPKGLQEPTSLLSPMGFSSMASKPKARRRPSAKDKNLPGKKVQQLVNPVPENASAPSKESPSLTLLLNSTNHVANGSNPVLNHHLVTTPTPKPILAKTVARLNSSSLAQNKMLNDILSAPASEPSPSLFLSNSSSSNSLLASNASGQQSVNPVLNGQRGQIRQIASKPQLTTARARPGSASSLLSSVSVDTNTINQPQQQLAATVINVTSGANSILRISSGGRGAFNQLGNNLTTISGQHHQLQSLLSTPTGSGDP